MAPHRTEAARHRHFRFSHPFAKAITGITAALAIAGFGALVFGPMADQRALDLATSGTAHGPVSAAEGLRAATVEGEAGAARSGTVKRGGERRADKGAILLAGSDATVQR